MPMKQTTCTCHSTRVLQTTNLALSLIHPGMIFEQLGGNTFNISLVILQQPQKKEEVSYTK